MTKICSKCKKELDLSAFGKCSKSKDGLKSSCKECRNAIKREYNRTHQKQAHDYKQMYMRTHVEEIQARNKKYKLEHKKEIAEKGKLYYQKNKVIIREKAIANAPVIKARKSKYNREVLNRYCILEEIEKVQNYELAKADGFKKWVRHHRLETHTSDGFLRPVQITKAELIALDMYYDRPAEELIWLNISVHRIVHGKERKKK